MNLFQNNLALAFLLTLFAGLSTSIGSLAAYYSKKTNTSFLSICLGFSAGVMIYVSFVEIFPKSVEILSDSMSLKLSEWYAVGGFFFGIILIGLIDRLVPDYENPHEMHHIEEIYTDEQKKVQKEKAMHRMGIFTALAIAIHNFPEGLATFTAALKDPGLGIPIAIAIAIHNIPEGIAVAVPIFYATGSRKKALLYSSLSGMAEPLGALIGYAVLRPFMTDVVFGFVFSSVAGIMVFISLDELLPSAEEYGEHHLSIYGLFIGMAFMAISLLLF
ncbi:MAG: zinc transporter ZupT [Candidatus Muiribacterium halophilum]|uniref:Zinc transporter ZupT n=1 Tax=Muiribacterium halophilum TaxID=2053465 RepID=A0A2N5ZGA3_MUIH1|nr:MAG: zinc transporter ZupT [Candidatus Muirbacterium halophilum]